MNFGNFTLGEPTSIDVLTVSRALKNDSQPSPSPSPSSPASAQSPSTDTDTRAAEAALARNSCPECGRNVKWAEHSWCDNCGYFPSAGMRIAITEAIQDEEIPPGEWYRLIPAWVWVTAGGMLVIIAASIGLRVALAESELRPTVALGFLATGALLACAAHVRAYFLAIQMNDKIGLFDFVIKPMEIWKSCTNKLPRTALTVNIGSWGMTIAACGALIIGGINYSSALDLIAVEPAEEGPPNAMHTAVAGARKMDDHGNGPKDLESAVNGFVGNQDVEDGTDSAAASAVPARRSLECSIYGFTRNINGDLHSILLAATLPGQARPRFVSKLSVDQIGNTQFVATLNRVLPGLRVRRPYVPTKTRAYWVKPDVKCMIRYEDWSSRHGLVKPVVQMLMVPDRLQQASTNGSGLAQR